MFRTTKFAMLFFALLAAMVAIPTKTPARENSLKKDKWALQFEIDRDFDLSGFQGNTLSIKKHTADTRAYRFGISFFLDYSDTESFNILNDSIFYPTVRVGESRRVDINLQKIYYANTAASVNLFYGMGAVLSFQHGENESETLNRARTQLRYSKFTSNSWATGLTGILGAEWFFADNMSLLGEYNTTAKYINSKREDVTRIIGSGVILNSSFTETKTESFRISSSSVKFGLSVYF